MNRPNLDGRRKTGARIQPPEKEDSEPRRLVFHAPDAEAQPPSEGPEHLFASAPPLGKLQAADCEIHSRRVVQDDRDCGSQSQKGILEFYPTAVKLSILRRTALRC